MSDDNANPPIGLALSGGAVLGAAHVGVLRALEEEGVRTGWVAGTSAGAVVGALHAFGIPAREIESLVRDQSWLSISNFKPSRMGLLSISRLGDFMINALGDVNLEDSPIPLALVAADIHTGKKKILHEGNLARAAMASSCIPGIFAPVQWEDRLLVDGGIVENLPISTVRWLGADRVLGVDLHTAGLYPQPKNVLDVVLNASSILMRNTIHIPQGEADVVVTPKLLAYNTVDSSRVPELIEEGYSATQELMDEIRGLLA